MWHNDAADLHEFVATILEKKKISQLILAIFNKWFIGQCVTAILALNYKIHGLCRPIEVGNLSRKGRKEKISLKGKFESLLRKEDTSLRQKGQSWSV